MQIHPLTLGWGVGFLIETETSLVLVDCGSPGQEDRVLSQMRALGRSDLTLIWITHAHYDHYGSAAALRRLTGAPVGVHPADAGFMVDGRSPLGTQRRRGRLFPLAQKLLGLVWPLTALTPDFTLEDGASLANWGLDAIVLHTPGHTPGHTCLLLPDRTAIAGDLLAGHPRPGLQRLLAEDWSQLGHSLARLQAAQPERVYTGHSHQPLTADILQGLRADGIRKEVG